MCQFLLPNFIPIWLSRNRLILVFLTMLFNCTDYIAQNSRMTAKRNVKLYGKKWPYLFCGAMPSFTSGV
jgi:hypothetical protein